MNARRWIPINTRLPDEGLGFVLIAVTHEGREDDESHLVYSEMDVANTTYVRHNADRGWYSHWMRLPAPPKP